MKVLVVGLLDKQAAQIPKYPGLDVRFTGSKNHGHASESAALFNTVDRILLMTKFTSHGTFARIDRAKLTMINGGMTRLKETLQTLSTSVKLEAKEAVTEVQPQEETTMARNDAVFDFSTLKVAEIGAELVFTKPNDMDVTKFVQFMDRGRSYYKRHHGLVTTCVFSGGKGRATVKLVAQEKPTLPQVNEARADHQGLAPAPAERVHAADVKPRIAEHGQDFWERVFLQERQLNPGGGAVAAVTCANIAHTAWMSRFAHAHASPTPTAEPTAEDPN